MCVYCDETVDSIIEERRYTFHCRPIFFGGAAGYLSLATAYGPDLDGRWVIYMQSGDNTDWNLVNYCPVCGRQLN